MLYDKLWEFALRADWRSMSAAYEALTVGVLVVAAVLIWNGIRMRKRMRRIETWLKKVQEDINLLQMQESRRLMTELNAKPREKIESPDTGLEIGGGDVAELTRSPPTPAQREREKSPKFGGQ
jgi:hypothetical protein